MTTIARCLLLGILIVAFSPAYAAKNADPTTQSKTDELNQINQQIIKLQAEIKNDSGHRTTLASQLQKNKDDLAKLQKRSAELKADLGKKQAALATLQKNHQNYQQQLDTQKDLAGKQLLSAYYLSYTDNGGQFLTYYNYLNDARVGVIDQTNKVLGRLETTQHKVAQQKVALQSTLTQQQKTQQQLTTIQQNQQRDLTQLSNQLQTKSNQLSKLIADRKALEQLLAQLERARKAREAREARERAQQKRNKGGRGVAVKEEWAPLPAGAPFTNLQGKLSWPTAGNIITHFGSPIGQSELKYNGVLISAPVGQPVKAIYQGRVVFANSLRGLGLLIIVDHGDGYLSLYGHNQSLYKKVGAIVKTGEVIAAVGDSDSSGQPGLYFEIRHNSKPLNPERWCK